MCQLVYEKWQLACLQPYDRKVRVLRAACLRIELDTESGSTIESHTLNYVRIQFVILDEFFQRIPTGDHEHHVDTIHLIKKMYFGVVLCDRGLFNYRGVVLHS